MPSLLCILLCMLSYTFIPRSSSTTPFVHVSPAPSHLTAFLFTFLPTIRSDLTCTCLSTPRPSLTALALRQDPGRGTWEVLGISRWVFMAIYVVPLRTYLKTE